MVREVSPDELEASGYGGFPVLGLKLWAFIGVTAAVPSQSAERCLLAVASPNAKHVSKADSREVLHGDTRAEQAANARDDG